MERKELQSAVFPDCPIRNVLARFTDKWTLLVLYTLEQKGTLRFNELYRSIPDISQKMLSITLKSLTGDGFLKRTLFPSVPPKVEYSLTERALDVMPLLDALLQWSIENFDAILADRRQNGVDTEE
ncbi:MAG: winged helix-turn-helix transcriptional regulator [Candidatus Cryptobacteroides sp.]